MAALVFYGAMIAIGVCGILLIVSLILFLIKIIFRK